MATIAEKETKIVDKIATAVQKMDDELAKLDALNEDKDKKHTMKKWYAEKKAIHQIKHILHEIGKYEKYDDKELEKVAKFFETFSQE